MKEDRIQKLVRCLRQRIFDYYDESEAKGLKATRILSKALKRLSIERAKHPPKTDQWGATADDRRLLAAHGIAWGD